MQRPIISQDLLWKAIIEDLFDDVLRFFYPKFVEEVDFSKPFEFLDKELQKLYPESNHKNRRADVLTKVFLKNGEEKWILIHIEIQGYEDTEFPLRMFTYNYRAYDRYKKDIVALAIFTDENESYCPFFYERELWETKIRYDFKTFKVLEFDEDYFEKMDNPFAVVMQTARSAIKNTQLKSDKDLLDYKVELFRRMLSKGYQKNKIRTVARFINHYVSFKTSDFHHKFEDTIYRITENQKAMGIIELVEQKTKEYWKEVGLEEGKEIGLEEGEKKVIALRRKTSSKLLDAKFSIEDIIELMDYTEDQIDQIRLEINIQQLLKNKVAIKNIVTQLSTTEELVKEIKEALDKENKK